MIPDVDFNMTEPTLIEREYGSAYVHFEVVDTWVSRNFKAYCKDNHERNDLVELSDGSFIWRRDPTASGKGVRKGNTTGDFLRAIADGAVFKSSTSRMMKKESRNWSTEFDPRHVAAMLVRVLNSGWDPVGTRITSDIQLVTAKLAFKPDGTVTGRWERQ